MNLSRRKFLTINASVAVSAFFGGRQAIASADDLNKAITEFTEGDESNSGLLILKSPDVSENGNSVPISVTVESPMTDEDYVESVIILAEDNANTEVVTFTFSPASGQAYASTRMRLAHTQPVIAVAKLSNGKFYKASTIVNVKNGGCGNNASD